MFHQARWYRADRDQLAPKWRYMIIVIVICYVVFLVSVNIAVAYNPIFPGENWYVISFSYKRCS